MNPFRKTNTRSDDFPGRDNIIRFDRRSRWQATLQLYCSLRTYGETIRLKKSQSIPSAPQKDQIRRFPYRSIDHPGRAKNTITYGYDNNHFPKDIILYFVAI